MSTKENLPFLPYDQAEHDRELARLQMQKENLTVYHLGASTVAETVLSAEEIEVNRTGAARARDALRSTTQPESHE